MAKKIIKTVNRTGKKIIKQALVVKAKKQVIIDKEKIKKINQEIKDQRSKIKDTDQKPKISEGKQGEIKQERKYDLTIGLKDLLAAGCHLGHKLSKTNPKAKEFIYAAKDGVQIIDLTKTLVKLQEACNFIHNAKRSGKQICLVGTKRQAREVVKRVALEVGVPYVTDRWLGGTITNWEQIRKSIKKLAELKEGLEKNKFTSNTKKEILDITKEKIRLEKIVGGLGNLDKLFDILFVIDAGFERTAVKEAKLRGIKIIAIVDTDGDPNKVDYAILANDDNVKSVGLIVEEIGKAIKSANSK